MRRDETARNVHSDNNNLGTTPSFPLLIQGKVGKATKSNYLVSPANFKACLPERE